jgi:TetR/AcrR family transcriptional regulator, transcriptional repressor for nem operon
MTMRYDKGHKDASRQRIVAVATERFKADGIAASGLAGIMSEAGLTNGAFYPHFKSKADLVRESLDTAIAAQCNQIRDLLADGGPERVIDVYLSREHRDAPGLGCASAALLPEIAREPLGTRGTYTQRQLALVEVMADAMPAGTPDPQGVVIGLYATLVGTLELARAVSDVEFSDRILAAGAAAAKAMLPKNERGATQGRRGGSY